MLFRSVLQTLGIVAGVSLMASFVASVSARPYTTTAHLVFREAAPPKDCRATILASKKRLLDKVAAQKYADEWCSQLERESWIQYSASSLCRGYDQFERVFMDDVTEFITSRQFLRKGENNLGIFTLPNHKLEHRMVKFVNVTEGYESAACEKKSLLDFGEQVMTGFTTVDKEKVGVIIMPKVDGTPIRDTHWWRNLSKDQRLYALNSTRKAVEQTVLDFLHEGKPLYTNFSPQRVLIDDDGGVDFMGYDYPGIWSIKVLPTKDQFDRWFDRRWAFLWGDVYREVDKMPEHQSRS
ncbi:hypothetical protein C8J55DRAFT_511249 [Lentinula edodes]|uniref:Uncharacterized protein n=1 Tax=Lentinula lateritia TaxID=40482 RepID=A0A9W9DS51_9AGAR|nr:hypothetical protein C8J55DRAFT_511249 [Lentinula edodes]